MEQDNEAKGSGNSYTTEFRQYDPRLGRWLSLDPLMDIQPFHSPYQAFNNNPIFFTDPLGLIGGPAQDKIKLPSISEGGMKQIQWNASQLNVNMDLAPDRFNKVTTTVVNGRKWNRAYYWSEAAKNNPEWFSADNMRLINSGKNPVPDELFVSKLGKGLSTADAFALKSMAQFDLTGELINAMEHHHANHGNFAFGLPRSVHRMFGNYKFWHNTKFRNVVKKGIKGFIFLGLMLSVTDIIAGNAGPADIAGIPSEFSSGWRKMLYSGLQDNNFKKVHAGSTNLEKLDGANFSYGWMTADDMVKLVNTGNLTTSMKSNNVLYRSVDHMLRTGSGIYPYMVIYLNNQPLGIVDVPETND